jgi:hypothetical protein
MHFESDGSDHTAEGAPKHNLFPSEGLVNLFQQASSPTLLYFLSRTRMTLRWLLWLNPDYLCCVHRAGYLEQP